MNIYKASMFLLSLSLSFLTSQSQNSPKALSIKRVEYITLINGTEDQERGKIILECNGEVAKITSESGGKQLIPEAPKETGFIDFAGKRTIQLAEFSDGKRISSVTPFEKLPQFEMLPDTEAIAGYLCHKAKAVVFSNTIEIWFTKEAIFIGGPSLGYVIEDALILRTVRNGNFEVRAVSVDLNPQNENLPVLPDDLGQLLEIQDYRQALSSAYIKTVNIFTDEQICWGNKTPNPINRDTAGVTYQFAGGTVILKKVKLPEVPSDANVFIELTQFSNGDAYDRTGSVFLIPVDSGQSFLDACFDSINNIPAFKSKSGKNYQGVIRTQEYTPIVELMRFFTPFGIRHYNDRVKISRYHWFDSVTYKQDITELLPLLKGDQWIGVYIGNYDDGGHKVSLKIDFHLNHREIQMESPEKSICLPLFNTTNVMEMAGQEYGTLFGSDTLSVWFDVPEGVSEPVLRYISTGHGGWENGDEFVPKQNTIFIDGKEKFKFTPWRTDCATYRLYNPASGNFWNGLSSSDYSRSGWCPGTATNPVLINLTGLTPGKHIIQVYIPQGEPEGGSFSSWNVSGVLLGKLR